MFQFARQQHKHTHKQNTNLVERWENVIGKLDLSDRRASRSGVADGKARDPLLTERRVEHAVFAVQLLQAVRDAEHAPLAFDDAERVAPRGVGHVLAEHDDARVAGHLVSQRLVDRGQHRARCGIGPRLAVEARRRGIDVRRVDEL